jgi:thiol-disulfide isomerase/thioredoxin
MAPTQPKSGAVAAARKKPVPWLWIGVAGLVILLAVAAIVSSGGSDKNKNTSAEGVEEVRPVTVTGTALEKLPQGGADPAVGKQIPEVKGASFDGTPINITNDGRPKLILFVAHWCPHCQREIPLLAKYLKSNPLPKGIDLVTVSTAVNKPQGNYPPSAWLKRENWLAPVMVDSDKGEAATAFGLPGFPYFVAADGSGKVVARTSGEISTDDFAALAARALGNQ